MGTEISAEERAKQINSRAETRIAKATESAKKLAEKEKALLQLQKEIAKEKKIISAGRKDASVKIKLALANEVIALFGMKKEERDCKTEADFVSVKNQLIGKIKSLMHTSDVPAKNA